MHRYYQQPSERISVDRVIEIQLIQWNKYTWYSDSNTVDTMRDMYSWCIHKRNRGDQQSADNCWCSRRIQFYAAFMEIHFLRTALPRARLINVIRYLPYRTWNMALMHWYDEHSSQCTRNIWVVKYFGVWQLRIISLLDFFTSYSRNTTQLQSIIRMIQYLIVQWDPSLSFIKHITIHC